MSMSKILQNIYLLLNQIGDPGLCKGCGKQIWWVTYKSGKKAPITMEALNHFADCPKAKDFKKQKEQQV